jgi:hypothetical protein
VDSITTRSTPWAARCSPSSPIPLVVAVTDHTLVTRRPPDRSAGQRVQTIPDALATSIVATRATNSTPSSTLTSTGFCINRSSRQR